MFAKIKKVYFLFFIFEASQPPGVLGTCLSCHWLETILNYRTLVEVVLFPLFIGLLNII